ncbi:zinc-dependent alcohol dehydrogenase family protein [Rhizobium sp. SSA_523]|uniref:zinc-dependent alcohol dehydrogenase family protein n=1 Tax=Rhizobium sp. SSA_523 TaxID=2952477 RepID=UPI00209137F8|nr:zinc-dependent alcohol dehydrogenase family protein [Rhizobium sp. SSA_523]MCO5731147.1 zinc-dependent alcohol dehydrogenase family protein [Rhizobium sp. SSA_523]WKC22307.1 zinc-dependent alcohol dehydrogenase family protein [Rhizobium sp. SSA_523]
MKIRAAVLDRTGVEPPYASARPLRIQEVDLEGPGRGEVLVRIAAAGLCHSDLSVIDGNRPRPLPMVLGHEASGVVEEVGADIHDLQAGDHVVFVFVPSCGHCLPCAEGRPALCEPGAAANGRGELLGGAMRLKRHGEPLHHHIGISCFADYATVSRRSLVKIDQDIALDVAGLMGCAVLTGAGAVFNSGDIRPGGSVAVVGLGGVGLAAVLGAVAAGAETIIAVDRLDSKLAAARQMGATHTFNAGDADLVAGLRALTKGGVEVALEFAGSVKALELAYAVTRRGGTTITAGLPHPAAMMQLPAASLVAEERILKGSYLGSGVPARDIPRFLNLYRRGKLPIDRLLTHRFRLDEINDGFDRLADGSALRQIVVFD